MDPWEHLEFLIGRWSSPVSGAPGEGVSGWTTFTYDLDQHVIVRKSRAEFAPQPGEATRLVHDDLLIIYRQPPENDLRAIYFDNEGHIIHYAVNIPHGGRPVVFESEATQVSPRARLVYEMAVEGILRIEFSVAAPGGELLSHVKGTVLRDG